MGKSRVHCKRNILTFVTYINIKPILRKDTSICSLTFPLTGQRLLLNVSFMEDGWSTLTMLENTIVSFDMLQLKTMIAGIGLEVNTFIHS